MKKTIIRSAAVAAFLAVAAGSLAVYVYTRNFGTDYQGRARLDYNWKYFITACPKEEYRYEGKFFSFSSPKFEKKNTLIEKTDEKGGSVVDTHRLMYIQWREKDEKGIKSELSRYLSSPDGQVAPSADFMGWLVGTGPKVPVYIEKIDLKGDGAAVIISGGKKDGYLQGLTADFGKKHVYIVGITHRGTIFYVEIDAPLSLPEDVYRERMFRIYSGSWYQSPTPKMYAESACVLTRFIKTFEIKKL